MADNKKNQSYYKHELKRPRWAPPSTVFGPVWTVLYILIVFSFGFVFLRSIQGHIPFIVVVPFILNLIFNIFYTPIEFGLKNNYLALLDVFFVWLTLVLSMMAIYSYAHWVVYVNIPYLLWVTFATILQAAVTWLNR